MYSLDCLIAAALVLATPVGLAQTAKDKAEIEFTRQQMSTTAPYEPKAGLVPDAKTAKAIAYAIGVAAYGEKMMRQEQPLRADLKNGIWSVLGTFHCASCDGGSVFVQIDKETGKIIRLNHSQ